ncbi:hypothetical protein V1292_000072 [Bradyrhizobium sp. AZCC 1719]|uniref:P-loop NTPase fold protein n=1 Tax=Bradyrhizobium sp. AZCC 1719 TaxID=3117028 RepID=UPI002FF0A4A6
MTEGKPSPTQMVIKELGRFLESKTSEVICIKGRWGVGKTYAWRQALKQAAASNKMALDTYSYVSLFGTTSLDQLKYSIFENRTSGHAIATGANMETFGQGIDTAIKAFGTKALEALAGKTATDLVQSGAFLMVRNQFVCIDDIERKGKDLRAMDILGLASTLVEQRNCKVVIILNDEQLDNESEKIDFLKYQEKVIDRSLAYSPSPEESIQIALGDNSKFGEMLGEFCARLNLSNIRVIKKIEKLVWQIYPIIEHYDSQIVKAHIHTLALLGWAHYSEHGKPGEKASNEKIVEFIFNRYGKGLYGQTHNLTPEEERVEALLRMYGFGKVDETDTLLNKGILNGYFDEDQIKHFADLSTAALQQSKIYSQWTAVWDRFYNSFDDDEKEFVEELLAAFQGAVKYLSLGDLNHSVKILKRLKYAAEASAILKMYMEQRSEEPVFFDLKASAFGEQIDDPDVRQACSEKLRANEIKRELHEMLLDIYKRNGWNSGDLEYLANRSVDDYYATFKIPLGKNHGKIVASALHFREFANQEEAYVTIVEKAEEALRRIAKEHELNAIRVGGLRIRWPDNANS